MKKAESFKVLKTKINLTKLILNKETDYLETEEFYNLIKYDYHEKNKKKALNLL